MTTFNAGAIEATLDLDVDPFQRALRLAREQGTEFARQTYAARLDLDSAGARAHLDQLEARLDRFGARRDAAHLEVQGAAQALAALTTLQGGLDRFGRTRATAEVNVRGTAETIAELAAARHELDAFGRTRATASIGADTAAFEVGIGGSISGMQALIALGIGLAPALVPGLAAATAAAAALGVALGGALGAGGVLAAGVIGNVMSVVKAHQTVAQGAQQVASTTQAAAAANQAEASAAHQVQQAEQSLADARRNAAQSTAAAAYQVKEAQYGVTQAQLALNDAVEAATKKLRDYRDQLEGQKLDQAGAELAVREARQQLAEVLADPTHTQLAADEAQHALDVAEYQLEQTKKSRDELKAQVKEDRADGVMGSKEVRAAQHQLMEAQHALTAAVQALANAKRSGAEAVAGAEYALAQAHQAQTAAAGQAAAAATAAQTANSAYADALNTISTPAAQAFLAALDDLKAAWGDFTDATQGPALGLVTQALEMAAKYLPLLAGPANAAADAVGGLFDQMDGWLSGGGMTMLTDWLTKNGPQFLTEFGDIIGDTFKLFNHLGRAFTPLAHQLLGAIDDWLKGLDRASRGLEHNPRFQAFIQYVTDNGPKFMHVLGGIGGLFITIGEALAPLGPPVLDALSTVLDSINGLSPTEVDLLLAAIGGIMLLTGVGELVGVALGVVGIAGAISQLSKSDNSGQLGQVTDDLNSLWGAVSGIALSWWKSFKPALDDMRPDLRKLANVLQDQLVPALHDFWDTFGPIARWLASEAAKEAAENLRLLAQGGTVLAIALAGLLEVLSGTFSADWDRVWANLGKTPVGYFTQLASDLKGPITDIVNDTLDRLTRGPDSLSGRLRSGFGVMMDGITSVWDGLKKAAGTPVKFVIDYVWNDGLRKVINAIPGVSDLGPVDTTGWPSYAAGGVLPGYSPGRDIHTFVSPTAGVLHLGGGEGILTTRAVDQLGGAGGVYELNRRAEAGNLSVLARMLHEQSHADGGIVYVDGEKMTRLAAAQLAVAEQASGINNTVIQGSYQPHTSYSGSSHMGGGVMDTGPGDFTMQSWLRKVAFAAWARNQSGYPQSVTPGSAEGTNLHVHSVSRIDPTAAGNAQVAAFMAGGNGMGGADYGPNPPVDQNLVAQAVALSGMSGAAIAAGGGGRNPFTQFLAAIQVAKDFAEKAPKLLDQLAGMGPWAGYAGDAARYAGNQTAGWVNDKIPGPGPFPAHVFDAGGWMQPGWAVNASRDPEAVLTGAQWQALSALASHGAVSVAGGMSRADVDRLVTAIESNRGVYAAVSSRDDIETALEALTAELRKP